MQDVAPWSLTLGDVLRAVDVDAGDVLVIRHTFKEDGLMSRAEATSERMLAYTREQGRAPGKIPATAPRWWLIFVAESGLRCRLAAVYENFGEVVAEQTETRRYFDLRSASLFDSLVDRLLIEWSRDPVNWAKTGTVASNFPVIEIADPQLFTFPGYHNFVLDYPDLQQVVSDSRYVKWQAALEAVKGIYVIADTATGRLYVGKADGNQRILGRWTAYAADGHGGDVELRKLLDKDPHHARNFRFSLLEVFPPHTPQAEVDRAEAHYKNALLTRTFGLNRN